MLKTILRFAAASLLATAVLGSPANAAWLTNGPGDGSLLIDALGNGSYSTGADYDPLGAAGSEPTTNSSEFFFRFGTSGLRDSIGNLTTATTYATTATSAASSFAISGLEFELVQTLSDMLGGGTTRVGTLLTQDFTITNTTSDALSFELIRYVESDIYFGGDYFDGVGRLVADGREIIFQTDNAVGTASSNIFYGISQEGDGTAIGYEAGFFGDVYNAVSAGANLGNTILGDGSDDDEFTDIGNENDMAMALGRYFELAPGATASFKASTIFSNGVVTKTSYPGAVPQTAPVPEPATWAMMIGGLALVGATLRRRRPALATA